MYFGLVIFWIILHKCPEFTLPMNSISTIFLCLVSSLGRIGLVREGIPPLHVEVGCPLKKVEICFLLLGGLAWPASSILRLILF